MKCSASFGLIIPVLMAVLVNCQTAQPPEAQTGDPAMPQALQDLLISASTDVYIGVGFDKEGNLQGARAFDDAARQLNSFVRSMDGEDWAWTISISPVFPYIESNAKTIYADKNWCAVSIPKNMNMAGFISPVQNCFFLENAVKEGAKHINGRIPADAKVALVNIGAANPSDAEFVLEELSTELVRLSKSGGTNYTLVDRSSLGAIYRERKFQFSGDVDDDTIVSVGNFLGADVVITGSITGEKAFRRLRIKVLDVKTARLLIQTNLKY